MIQVEHLYFAYGKKKVLDDVSFRADRGDCVAILGKNGAGKSTLITCINKINKPTEGEIWLENRAVSQWSLMELAREMAYVAQRNEAGLMTVFDAVLIGRKPYIKWSMRQRDLDLCAQVIQELGLEHIQMRLLTELSGGEFQKVMLARAFVQEPKILLLDESTSNLDPYNQYETLALVQKKVKENGLVALMVLHDLNLALRYCNRFILLHEGRVFAHGGVEILTAENLYTVYKIKAALHKIEGYQTIVIKE